MLWPPIATILTGLLVAGAIATEAGAATALLGYNVDLALPETNLREEPSLAGTVLRDDLVSFTVRNAAGTSVCTGKLQERVVRSTASGELDFYYRIRDTRGSGIIMGITASNFAGEEVRVGYRSDSLGREAPTRAFRYPAPGISVVIGGMDLSCARHEESHFILVRTDATDYGPGGTARITARDGDTTLFSLKPD